MADWKALPKFEVAPKIEGEAEGLDEESVSEVLEDVFVDVLVANTFLLVPSENARAPNGVLEEYRIQLKDIEEALKTDPDNDSLKEIQKEIQNLIDLLVEEEPKKELKQINIPESISASSHIEFDIGEIVYAKTKLDRVYSKAKITSISGNYKVITVSFLDSDEVENYPIEEIYKEKPKDIKKYKKQQQQQISSKPKVDSYEKELNKGAQSWKNFTKKKKKSNESIFKTSDTVGSKVGVIGSGKPMSTVLKPERPPQRYNPY
ncbi:hypothetical protein WICMUC_001207 [Wickerhamomyces mucosus]|uniref:Tudor domain-containing protein n=1 Tax=Wickerhamomyces mucosus TaxID=1378264 RepID=A0A9P8PX37_9ASCO|nr:hypothetical protein WICMUC_001207 [Wickerhamomyces mucosus]